MITLKSKLNYYYGTDDEFLTVLLTDILNNKKYVMKINFEEIETYKPLTYEEISAIKYDGLIATKDLLQEILNTIWNAGMRPIGFNDVKNEITAIKDHLKDMRTIAFKKLGI